jgi:creatinine amidohydrolase
VDCWRCADINGKGIFDNEGYMAHGHAAESGTSVLLYLRPDLVRNSEITTVRPDPSYYTMYPDIIRYTKFSEKTSNGMVGDAESATAEKGRLIVERCVERIAGFMKKEFAL